MTSPSPLHRTPYPVEHQLREEAEGVEREDAGVRRRSPMRQPMEIVFLTRKGFWRNELSRFCPKFPTSMMNEQKRSALIQIHRLLVMGQSSYRYRCTLVTEVQRPVSYH